MESKIEDFSVRHEIAKISTVPSDLWNLFIYFYLHPGRSSLQCSQGSVSGFSYSLTSENYIY